MRADEKLITSVNAKARERAKQYKGREVEKNSTGGCVSWSSLINRHPQAGRH